MKKLYLTENIWLQYSEEKFEELPIVNLITDENVRIKAKQMKVNRFDGRVFVVIAPVDMFEEEGEEDE